jgi:hypothetical protein
MITLLREFKLRYFLWQHEILQFNLIFTSTLAHNLWGINSEFSHVSFVSLDAVG